MVDVDDGLLQLRQACGVKAEGEAQRLQRLANSGDGIQRGADTAGFLQLSELERRCIG